VVRCVLAAMADGGGRVTVEELEAAEEALVSEEEVGAVLAHQSTGGCDGAAVGLTAAGTLAAASQLDRLASCVACAKGVELLAAIGVESLAEAVQGAGEDAAATGLLSSAIVVFTQAVKLDPLACEPLRQRAIAHLALCNALESLEAETSTVSEGQGEVVVGGGGGGGGSSKNSSGAAATALVKAHADALQSTKRPTSGAAEFELLGKILLRQGDHEDAADALWQGMRLVSPEGVVIPGQQEQQERLAALLQDSVQEARAALGLSELNLVADDDWAVSSNVEVLVGSNHAAFTEAQTDSVCVLYHKAACPVCTNYMPVFHDLAERLSGRDSIAFGTIDISKNDVTIRGDIEITDTPTVLLYKSAPLGGGTVTLNGVFTAEGGDQMMVQIAEHL
jgi:uncharacterized protein (DUF779 family)